MQKLFSLLILSLFFLTGCKTASKSDRCDVLVSIPPYLYFVDFLSEGELSAVSLVPDQANPHLYEPTPRQVSEAKSAKVWIRLSESFETKIATSLEKQNPSLVVVNLAKELSLPLLKGQKLCSCGHHHESIDLHFWLSLRLAKEQAKLIAGAIGKAFPERKEQLERTLALLQEKLHSLDLTITNELAPFAKEAILVSHPAFAYFCHDYDLEQLSIECEGKDPLPQQIDSILESAKTIKIRTVLTQVQYNNKGAEKIAKLLNLKVHEVDPYSANYLQNVSYIANCIANP
jgi:zinc transport system substrate-binding protein